MQVPIIRTEEENFILNNNGKGENKMENKMEERSEERTEKLEMLLYKLRRARWIHKRTSKYYEPKNIMLIALSFCVSSAISILSIWNTGSTNSKTNYYIGSTITVVGFLNGLMTLMTNQLDYKTKINNNNLAAKAYDRLITHVCFEINFPSAVSCQEFVGEVEEKILKIKNELEVITEDRFEKELNKLITDSDSYDIITSEAGYEPKKSLFNFKFLKKNKHSSNNSSNNSVNGNNPIDNNLLADHEYKNNKIPKPTKPKKRPSDGFTTSTPSRSSTDNIRQQQEQQQLQQKNQQRQKEQEYQRQEEYQRQQEQHKQEYQKQELRQLYQIPRKIYNESYQLETLNNPISSSSSNINQNNKNNPLEQFKPRIAETNLSKIYEDVNSLSSIQTIPPSNNHNNSNNTNPNNNEEQTTPNNFLNIKNKSSSLESLVLLQNGKSSPTLQLELGSNNQVSEILPEFLDFNEKQKQDLINEKQKKNLFEQENMIKRRENMIRDLENEKNSRLQELNDLEQLRIEYFNMIKEPSSMNFSSPISSSISSSIRPQQILPQTPPSFQNVQRRQQSTTTRPLNLTIPQLNLQTNQVSTPSPISPSLTSSQPQFTSSPQSPPRSVLPLSIYNMRKL